MKSNKEKCPAVDIELAKQLLRYDDKTGIHYWKVDRGRGVKAGDVAGYLHRSGYVYIGLLGKSYQAHRLGYAVYYNDNLDGYEVNHISHDRTDNSIDNLFKVDSSGQNRDRAMSSRNTSGYTGVSWHEGTQKWRVNVGGKYIGLFEDLELAGFVAELTRDKLGYSKNHGRPINEIQNNPA